MVVKTVDAKSFFNFFRTIDAVNTEKNPLELNDEVCIIVNLGIKFEKST